MLVRAVYLLLHGQFWNKDRHSLQSTSFVKVGLISLPLVGHVHWAQLFLLSMNVKSDFDPGFTQVKPAF